MLVLLFFYPPFCGSFLALSFFFLTHYGKDHLEVQLGTRTVTVQKTKEKKALVGGGIRRLSQY